MRLGCLVAAGVVVLTSACGPVEADESQHSAFATAEELLAALPVAEEDRSAGYNAAEWEVEQPVTPSSHLPGGGKSCTTRELVVQQQSMGLAQLNADCKAYCPEKAGEPCWTSLYDRRATANPDELAVDRIVSPAEAARSPVDGSGLAGEPFVPAEKAWSASEKQVFYQDWTNLAVVTAAVHEAKGALDPHDWQPVSESAWCKFGSEYAAVKIHYRLSVDKAEKTTLSGMLAMCPGGRTDIKALEPRL